MIRNVADSLTDQDPETGEIVPWLATDWESAATPLTYTFNLRDDVTFSDGTPFNAGRRRARAASGKVTLAAAAALRRVYICGLQGDKVRRQRHGRGPLHAPRTRPSCRQRRPRTSAILAASRTTTTPEERCLGESSARRVHARQLHAPPSRPCSQARRLQLGDRAERPPGRGLPRRGPHQLRGRGQRPGRQPGQRSDRHRVAAQPVHSRADQQTITSGGGNDREPVAAGTVVPPIYPNVAKGTPGREGGA